MLFRSRSEDEEKQWPGMYHATISQPHYMIDTMLSINFMHGIVGQYQEDEKMDSRMIECMRAIGIICRTEKIGRASCRERG